MYTDKPLPIPDCWDSTDQYIENVLEFATTSTIFQRLCGGVHILDFFTNQPGLFQVVIPPDWQQYLLDVDSMDLLDVLMRDDLEALPEASRPPETLLYYIQDVRRFSLSRGFSVGEQKPSKLSRQVTVGMKPKKIHEVGNFADYIEKVAAHFSSVSGQDITHFIDFGSGQNYLGRVLASSPYNKHVVAVEGREHNITGAKELDMLAGVSKKEKVIRNKKLWKAGKTGAVDMNANGGSGVDFRPTKELNGIYTPEHGKGFIEYISGQLDSGDLSDIITRLDAGDPEDQSEKEARMMTISIHSCGNLSHYGIQSLVMNPQVRAVAIVGCCYNLMTERLGPPTHKLSCMRPSLQALNGRVVRESNKFDPQGFPMSDWLCNYRNSGIRFNITARMMACQAPQNWTEKDSDGFFTRHLYRAILQKIFLDKGVINKVYHDGASNTSDSSSPFDTSTNPVIIGSLRKKCYSSLHSYVRGAITKLTTQSDFHQYCEVIREKMADITDEEISHYESSFLPRKKEVSAIWSLMAFSAAVVESIVVLDRWLFLKQHPSIVQDAWVETVFDFQESPRNLAVMGIKNQGA